MNETKTIRGFRQVIQDLLVPEFRVLQVKVDSNTAEIKTLSDKVDKLTETTLRLLEKFDASLKYAELSERLARLEEKVNQ